MVPMLLRGHHSGRSAFRRCKASRCAAFPRRAWERSNMKGRGKGCAPSHQPSPAGERGTVWGFAFVGAPPSGRSFWTETAVAPACAARARLPPGRGGIRPWLPASDLAHELGLELHRADALDLAVDVTVAVAQADVLDLGADLDHRRRALDLQVLDHGNGVAVLQDVADRILDDPGIVIGRLCRVGRPLMGALGA